MEEEKKACITKKNGKEKHFKIVFSWNRTTDLEANWIGFFDSDYIDSDVFIASYCVVSPYMYNFNFNYL